MKKIVGIWTFDESIDPALFCKNAKDWNIDYAILHPGYFANDVMSDELRKNDLRAWLNLPIFYNPKHLEKKPEDYSITNLGRKASKAWSHFVCPQNEAYLEMLIREYMAVVRELQPDIISLDFIRYYVFWESVDIFGSDEDIESGCYCPRCIDAFEDEIGEKVDRDNPFSYIRKHLLAEWGAWKVGRITSITKTLVDEIRKNSARSKIAIKTVPWRKGDLNNAISHVVGQDVAELSKHVDYMAPMAFAHDLRQTPAWKRDLLEETKAITGRPVMSYLQVSAINVPESLSTASFERELNDFASGDYVGLPIFCYEQLVGEKDKATLVRNYLGGIA